MIKKVIVARKMFLDQLIWNKGNIILHLTKVQEKALITILKQSMALEYLLSLC
jgi:hypothetical protein